FRSPTFPATPHFQSKPQLHLFHCQTHNNPKMSISIREWIRWESDHPPGLTREPTNTLVLTSPESRFVDIRILKSAQSDNTIPQLARDAAMLPFTHLNWAFAGFSSSEITPDGITKSTWNHFVDSRYPDTSQVSDSGLMYPQPNCNLTLETGSMLKPITSKIESYEEMWRDIRPSAGVAVLQLHDDEASTRGMVVRVGNFCQGVVRQGEKFALERWEWEGDKEGWKRQARMGDLWMPCGVATEREKLVMGGKVKFGEDVWEVVELS
ncbi:hypothetical protein HII31_03348, partial [Pseudocercospora fuligena]